MNIDITDIDTRAHGLDANFVNLAKFAQDRVDEGKTVSDEAVSWLINPLPVYAALETEDFKKLQRKHAERYYQRKEKSIKMVRVIKKEFHSFLCSDSKKYRKDRESVGSNVNTAITAISSVIAATHGIELGIVTAVVALLFVIAGRIGKNAYCEVYNPSRNK